MELDWSVIPDYFDLFMEGAGVTLVISLLAIGLALALGFDLRLALCQSRLSLGRTCLSGLSSLHALHEAHGGCSVH